MFSSLLCDVDDKLFKIELRTVGRVHGSYEALKTGSAAEAMVDFTSGVVESFDLGSKAPDDLFQIMLDSVKRQSLMGCSIIAKPNETGMTLDNGLVKGQNYTLTGAKKVKLHHKNILSPSHPPPARLFSFCSLSVLAHVIV